MNDSHSPNIIVIWGDPLGPTPNLDRLADEGVRFTNAFGEQCCTAGRRSFLTGRRDPGRAARPTVAELLTPLGYATGQFGRHRLGDRNQFLPTVHGFDEFFGAFDHLAGAEEPDPDIPRFRDLYRPRDVLHSWAADTDDPAEHPRYGRVGRQRIVDAGPLTRTRMATFDVETRRHATAFIDRHHAAGRPFFVWFSTTCPTTDHDEVAGALLDHLDRLGIAGNTVVVHSAGDGPRANPSRAGAVLSPLIRWPGVVPAGATCAAPVSHRDWLPTFLAAAGEPEITRKLADGHPIGGVTHRVHLDGYNLLPCLTWNVAVPEQRGFSRTA